MTLYDNARTLFKTLSWPSINEEDWRRTDLARLLPKGLLDGAAAEKVMGDGVDTAVLPAAALPKGFSAHLVMQKGRPTALSMDDSALEAGLEIRWISPEHFSGELEEAGRMEMEAAADRVTAWHWRDLTGAVSIRVPEACAPAGPVLVENLESGDHRISTPHLHLEVERGGTLNLLWLLEGSPRDHRVVNAAVSGLAGDNADLNLNLTQNLGKGTSLFLHQRLRTERDARLRIRECHWGSSLVKTRTRALLDGSGSRAELRGLFLTDEGRHMDLGTRQEHRAPHTSSDALYKGAVQRGGRSVYQGMIEVEAEASKTDAYLTNNNLILGDGARADSMPKLNILTDDVRCSHGSTTGKLSPNQLFYLLSRGYDPNEAMRELARGFLAETLDGAIDVITPILEKNLDRALDLL